MKRSEINAVVKEAKNAFRDHGWVLPPNPKWDVTDFGLGEFSKYGLVLINLAEQPEYCEKIMYIKHKQVTLTHHHASKKEDIICRWGKLAIEFPKKLKKVKLQVNGKERDISTNKPLILNSGERITLVPNIPHAFWAESEYVVAGEVSTANDDLHDNFFENKDVGRFSEIEEDEPRIVKLVSD